MCGISYVGQSRGDRKFLVYQQNDLENVLQFLQFHLTKDTLFKELSFAKTIIRTYCHFLLSPQCKDCHSRKTV